MQLSIYIDEKLVGRLDHWANREKRSRSNLVQKILTDTLEGPTSSIQTKPSGLATPYNDSQDFRELLKSKRGEILEITTKYGARNIRLFGSTVRGDAGPESDIDLLVEMKKGRSLLDLVALGQELEELLGRKVDLLTDGGISPYLKDRIYSEAIPL